jgi:myo-inositol 2-dehydrogenase/D-chiro-inositol 1-dehydrogenase
MKFALLGTDPITIKVAQAVAASGQQLNAVFQPAEGHLAQLRTWAPGIELAESWQELLADGVADVIIVAHGPRDDRVEPLRLLFQTGIPVMVSHPVVQSMLDYYELAMNREDGGGEVLPLVPACWHPAVEQLRQMMSPGGAGSLGRVEQIVFDRQLPQRTKEQVLEHFVRDVGLARLLAGDLTKVGAMATTGTEADYSALGIQMSGPSGVVVRWSVRPVEQAPGMRVTVLGEAGSAALSADGDSAWTLTRRAEGGSELWEFADWDAGEAALDKLAAALDGAQAQPDWLDAARDMELADAVERSVHKGRTIDIHYEEHTEQGTFKGMMAAGGCALLMAALALLVVATTAVNWHVPLAEYWPYILVAVLAVFLLLQSLKLAFPGRSAPPGESGPRQRP